MYIIVWGEACTVFWYGDLRERDHWGDPGVDGKIILRWIFRKWDVGRSEEHTSELQSPR
jgi:hypothetical protein